MTVSKRYVKKLRAEFPRIGLLGSSVNRATHNRYNLAMKAKEVQAFFERVACKARVAEQGSN
jgi:hypothetical protein